MPLLLRIFVNLYYKLYRLLLYPIYLLWQRAAGLVILAIVGFLFIQFYTMGEDEPAVVPGPKDVTIQQVTRVEDGNSAFASDLLLQMNEDELRAYSTVFYDIMQMQPTGQPRDWNHFNIHGRITPTSTFKNNLGHTCRNFEEVLKVKQTQQTLEGIACEHKHGSWCKLRRTSTPVCGLKARGGGGILDSIGRSLDGLF